MDKNIEINIQGTTRNKIFISIWVVALTCLSVAIFYSGNLRLALPFLPGVAVISILFYMLNYDSRHILTETTIQHFITKPFKWKFKPMNLGNIHAVLLRIESVSHESPELANKLYIKYTSSPKYIGMDEEVKLCSFLKNNIVTINDVVLSPAEAGKMIADFLNVPFVDEFKERRGKSKL